MNAPFPSTADGGDAAIVRYARGDEHAIAECMRACFGVAPRLASWEHVYLENSGGEPAIVVARVGERVVSHLALLPRRIRVFGVDGVAGHSIDTMTHPDWQRRGLMSALAAASIRYAHERGFLATYGVANVRSMHGITKYEERTPLGPFPVLVRPVRPLAALRRAIGDWRRRRMTPDAVASAPIIECAAVGPAPDPRGTTWLGAVAPGWSRPRFDARHTALFDDVEGVPPIALIRDAAHLAWRYPAVEGFPYWQRDIPGGDGIAASAVIRVAELAGVQMIFLMEWHWRRGAAAAGRELLRDAIAIARRGGLDGVAVLAGRGTPHRRMLRRHAFLPIPEALFPRLSRLSVRPDADADVARWRVPANWYYTWGDGLLL